MAVHLFEVGIGAVVAVFLAIIAMRLHDLTPAPAPRIHARPTDAAPFGVAWTPALEADARSWSAAGCPMPDMPTEPVRVCADGHRALIPVRGVLPTRPRWVCTHGHPAVGTVRTVETLVDLPAAPPRPAEAGPARVTVTVLSARLAIGGGR